MAEIMGQELGQEVRELVSPGGHIFGVQGWTWGEQRPKSITFFLDGTARVSDQWGRPIKGFVRDGQGVYMSKLSHAQVISYLNEEFRMDVIAEMGNTGMMCRGCKGARKIGDKACTRCIGPTNEGTGLEPIVQTAGWPQLPYDELKKMKTLPPTPIEQLKKIKDPELRKAALRIRREVDAEMAKEAQATEDDD